MRRAVFALGLLTLTGCSTAPVADVLDHFRPGGLPKRRFEPGRPRPEVVLPPTDVPAPPGPGLTPGGVALPPPAPGPAVPPPEPVTGPPPGFPG